MTHEKYLVRMSEIAEREKVATPGPWEAIVFSQPLADTGDYIDSFLVRDSKKQMVANCSYTADEGDTTESNIRLIAASRTDLPALREALEIAVLGLKFAETNNSDAINGLARGFIAEAEKDIRLSQLNIKEALERIWKRIAND